LNHNNFPEPKLLWYQYTSCLLNLLNTAVSKILKGLPILILVCNSSFLSYCLFLCTGTFNKVDEDHVNDTLVILTICVRHNKKQRYLNKTYKVVYGHLAILVQRYLSSGEQNEPL